MKKLRIHTGKQIYWADAVIVDHLSGVITLDGKHTVMLTSMDQLEIKLAWPQEALKAELNENF